MQHINKNIEVSGFETMAESMEFADNYNNWILGKFKNFMGKSLLEIGTGQGNFKKYVSGNFSSLVKNYKLNSIICLNVLEHVPDHKAGINNMLDALEKDGHLLLFVPAF